MSRSPNPDLRDLPELGRAREWWQRNRHREALRLFEKTARKHPANVHALADAGRAFGQRLKLEQAERYLLRLEEVSAGHASGLEMAAQSHLMLRRGPDALRNFRRALCLEPANPRIALQFAAALERTNDVVAAAGLVESHGEETPDWQLLRGRLAMRRRDWDGAIAILRPLTVSGTPLPFITEAWSRLAQCHDRLGQFSEAIDAITRRAAVLRPHAGPMIERAAFEERQLGSLLATLDRKMLEGWLREPDGTVLFTGPARSGTTLAMRLLQAHPAVSVSDEREILASLILPAMAGAIQPPPDPLTSAHLDELPDTVLRRIANSHEAALTATSGTASGIRIDKSPSLGPMIPVFLRIRPGGRILHAQRDPRDVLISSLMRELPLNSVSCRFLEPADAARRIRFELDAWSRLRALLPEDRSMEIDYEDLVDDPASEINRVFEFVGLAPPRNPPLQAKPMAGEWINSPTYADVVEPVNRAAVGRWRNYQPWLAGAFRILEERE